MLESRINKCIEMHNKGYNCAQSIACVYCDLEDTPEVEAFRSVEGFGFGMGCNLTCGVLSAIAYLIGLKYSDGNLEEPKTKHDCYEKMEEIKKLFIDYTKETSCYVLKGVNRGLMLDCSWIIAYGAYLVENYLYSGLFVKSDSYLNYKRSN